MNEKEKTDFYIATCRCCLLAEMMKGCQTCNFNIGLAEKHQSNTPIAVSLPIAVTQFALSEQHSSIELNYYSQGEITR
jgi:hypothetical protein